MKKHFIKVCFAFINLLIILSFFLHNTQVKAQTQTAPTPELLSQMTADECLDFVIQNNIEIPTGLENNTVLLKEFVKQTIDIVESNPKYNFAYNFYKIQKFAEDVKELVNNYYEVSINDNSSYFSTTSSYQLQYNYVYKEGEWVVSGGDWLEKWSNYNCYAYSINRSESNEKYTTQSQYQPGDFAGTGSYSIGMPINDLANIIKADLEAIGLTNVTIIDSIPTSLNSNQKLICVRTGSIDYHLMRFDPITNAWYHKPGNTAVLKYKYIPSNSLDWITETSYEGEEYYNGFRYNSSIKYIVYDIDRLVLNCRTNEQTVNKNILMGKDIIYEINIGCAKSYKLISNSSYRIEMYLYDEDMNLLNITPTMSNNNCTAEITSYLSFRTYYLRLKFYYPSKSGNVTTTYQATWPTLDYQVYYSNVPNKNNVLPHLHEIDNNQFQNQLYYVNSNGAGFYEFKLTGTSLNGSSITYPNGAIKVYDENSKLAPMDKFSLTGYANQASTKYNDNRMVVYLPRNGSFYIDVNMTTNSLSSLYLDITSVDLQELDLFGLSASTSQSISIFNETTKGDYFECLDIKQTGKFTVSASYSGNQTNDILFVLTRQLYNSSSDTYSLDTKIIELMDTDNDSYTGTLTLEKGVYYVGYFNKHDVSNFSVTFNRLVTQYGEQVLVTDPDCDTLCGSQIRIIEMNQTNKSYRGTFITKDFTRLIYPDYNFGVSASRLDYYWYSNDETKATVTPYGTVFGRGLGTVKIMAVLKSDPSKVFIKEFTIINDTGSDPLVVNSTYKVKYSELTNGKFHFNLEKTNCPYPWLQYYNWSLDTTCHNSGIIASMDDWGEITVDGPGCFTLTGAYCLNSRVTVVVHVVVEP
ncbi:MAG TPA: hypothetical protein PLR16_00855 [Bacilli bacterium]|nr:MAG: hypothetical protein BWY97_00437 [Tenericutes bacterium ADurb.BinA124]HPX83821.1 hypothetical protein [Bacilli bacterium]